METQTHTANPMSPEEPTMPESANVPTAFGGMDEHKQRWLTSLGLRDDKCVLDCDPTVGKVQMADGRIRQTTERWSRVMGYHRPVSEWNVGKQQEFADRKFFEESAIKFI